MYFSLDPRERKELGGFSDSYAEELPFQSVVFLPEYQRSPQGRSLLRPVPSLTKVATFPESLAVSLRLTWVDQSSSSDQLNRLADIYRPPLRELPSHSLTDAVKQKASRLSAAHTVIVELLT